MTTFVTYILQIEGFYEFVVYVGTCIFICGIYFWFQDIINIILSPLVDYLLKYFRIKPKSTIEDILQTNDIKTKQIEYTKPDYEESKKSAQLIINAEKEKALQYVISYTTEQLANYMEEEQLKQLCNYIKMLQHGTINDYKEIKNHIKVNDKIKTIDLMHFGWNINEYLDIKDNMKVATFLKYVFADSFQNTEINSIYSKLHEQDRNCIIKTDDEFKKKKKQNKGAKI